MGVGVRVSPAPTPKKISMTRTPGPSDQARHSRGRSLSSTAGPLFPRPLVTERQRGQARERAPYSARGQGDRAKPGQQGRRTLPGQWARGGHGDSESHVRGHIVWTILLLSCLSLLRVVVRRCCCCFSLFMSTSIPEPSPLQPRNLYCTSSLVLPVFRPPCQLDRRGDVPGLPTSSWV